ncbi:hypothetical protein [Nonomuraea sp. NPDC005501]|uniref:hypothetical protein n=1 Tax=Nonomuraea sp. NPDC005501 TaxID=3156884 RepID=UPI0033A7B972
MAPPNPPADAAAAARASQESVADSLAHGTTSEAVPAQARDAQHQHQAAPEEDVPVRSALPIMLSRERPRLTFEATLYDRRTVTVVRRADGGAPLMPFVQHGDRSCSWDSSDPSDQIPVTPDWGRRRSPADEAHALASSLLMRHSWFCQTNLSKTV